MSYTKEQTRAMLMEAVILVMEDCSYRIINCPAVDDEDSDYIMALDEEDGDEVSINIRDIDLSAPNVLLYKLTLMNP